MPSTSILFSSNKKQMINFNVFLHISIWPISNSYSPSIRSSTWENKFEKFWNLTGTSHVIKNPSPMQVSMVHAWVGKSPWRRAWWPSAVFLPGESQWTDEPGGRQSMGSQIVGHNWVLSTTHSCAWFILLLIKFYTIGIVYTLNIAFLYSNMKWSEVAQLCPTLCDPVDCSLPGSSIHRIFLARVLEWVAISFFHDLPNPGMEPRSPTL